MYGDMFKGLGGCLVAAGCLILALGAVIGVFLPKLWHWIVPIIHAWSAP